MTEKCTAVTLLVPQPVADNGNVFSGSMVAVALLIVYRAEL